MDSDRFDALTRAVGATRSRRAVLRTLAGALAAAFTGAALPGSGEAAKCGGEGEPCGCCKPGLTCTAGACCPDDRVCNGACCPAGHACQGGACVQSGGGNGNPGGCPDGQARCGGGCVDIAGDLANCGACGVACPASTDPCQVAVCVGGVCGFAAGNEGATCLSGNLCTTNDTCRGGVCAAGTDVVTPTCLALDACHVAGVCDPATGQCTNPNADGISCDDGLACTTGDYCLDGICQRGAPVVCDDPGPCQLSVACDPATGGCVAVDKPDRTLCGADNACSHDVCQAGTCVENVPKLQGTACNDSNSCTQTDACDGAGLCIGGNPVTCPPADACHDAGTCNTDSGVCGATPISTGTCFVGGTCYAAGASDPANPCRVCDPSISQTDFSAGNEGGVCDDGDPCTSGDVCRAGVCVGGTATVCAASDQCHEAGVCDPATGLCSNPDKPDGTTCGDANRCTTGDTCRAGVCTGGTPVVCAASDQCHEAGTCDPGTGTCSNPAKANGATCDDGDAATCNDTCQNGVCVGSPCIVCPPNTTLRDGLCCRPNSIPDPDLGFCLDCGGALDYCCPEDVASTPCRNFGTCRDGRCQPCGTDGNNCCSGGTCLEGKCLDGICLVCGEPGQPCCPDEACDQRGRELVCVGTGVFAGSCQFCGDRGEPCCPGETCNAANNVCITVGQYAGFCRVCGVDGQACCADGGCGSDNNLTCIDGTCRFCGVPGFPPCA